MPKRDLLANRSISLQAEQFLGGPVVEQDIEVSRLADVVEINPKKSEVRPLPPETMVSFVPMEELNTDRPSFSAPRERPISEVLTGYTYFRDGDVLLAKITPCFENGKAGIARNLRNGIGFGSSEYYVFRCSEKIVPEYLYYLITRPAFREEGAGKMSGTGGQQRVTREFLENYEIPLPPLDEQRRIVAEIEGYQQVIDGARQILAAYAPQIVPEADWEQPAIGDVCENFMNGLNFSKEQMGHGVKFVNIKDVFSQDLVNCEPLGRVDVSPREVEKRLVRPNDILFVRSSVKRDGVGYASMMPPHSEPVVFCGFIIKCTPKPEIVLPKYLFYVLRTPTVRQRLIEISSTAAITNISQDKIQTVQIPLPPLPEQERIVAELDAEAARMESVRGLIPAFEAKIARTLARLWGKPC